MVKKKYMVLVTAFLLVLFAYLPFPTSYAKEALDLSGISLMKAIKEGDVDRAIEIVESGSKLNIYQYGDTPLTLAIGRNYKHEYSDLIGTMLKAGADVNMPQNARKHKTPLISAVRTTDLRVVKLLLDYGARVSDRDVDGSTALMMAADNVNERGAELLLDNGADLDAKDKMGRNVFAYVKKDSIYKSSIPIVLKAYQGDVEAQHELAWIHEQNGRQAKALNWYRKAAESGNIISIARLAQAYGIGQLGLSVNEEQYEYWASRIPEVRKYAAAYRNGRFLHAKHFEFQRSLQAQLITAVGKGDFESVRQLINIGANKDAVDYRTPILIVAIQKGHLDIAHFLVDSGANTNVWKKGKGISVLRSAIYGGDHDLVAKLLNNGADPNTRGRENSNKNMSPMSPLVSAAGIGDNEIIELLIEKGAIIKGGDGAKALSYSLSKGHAATFNYLLELGAELNEDSLDDLLLTATINGLTDTVKFLLNQGADSNSTGRSEVYGNNVIGIAISSGHAEIVRILLDHGAKIEGAIYSLQYGGRHYLKDVPEKHRPAMIKLLYEHAMDKSKEGYHPCTALVYAVIAGRIDVLPRLLSEKIETRQNRRTLSYNDALQAAASYGHVDIVKLLLQHGAKVNTEYYSDSLMEAVRTDNFELVKVLVEHGAPFNTKEPLGEGEEGLTVLETALSRGNEAIIKAIQAHKPIYDFINEEQAETDSGSRQKQAAALADYLYKNAKFIDTDRPIIQKISAYIDKHLQTDSGNPVLWFFKGRVSAILHSIRQKDMLQNRMTKEQKENDPDSLELKDKAIKFYKRAIELETLGEHAIGLNLTMLKSASTYAFSDTDMLVMAGRLKLKRVKAHYEERPPVPGYERRVYGSIVRAYRSAKRYDEALTVLDEMKEVFPSPSLLEKIEAEIKQVNAYKANPSWKIGDPVPTEKIATKTEQKPQNHSDKITSPKPTSWIVSYVAGTMSSAEAYLIRLTLITAMLLIGFAVIVYIIRRPR